MQISSEPQALISAVEVAGATEGGIKTGDDLGAGCYVHIEVKDIGPGMPEDVIEKAFDPFFTTKFIGRGLGRSAVLGIMRAHNGAVRLETIPNSGTTVHLFFPVDATEHDRALSLTPATQSRRSESASLA
jgi:signal transduction histidine kinase